MRMVQQPRKKCRTEQESAMPTAIHGQLREPTKSSHNPRLPDNSWFDEEDLEPSSTKTLTEPDDYSSAAASASLRTVLAKNYWNIRFSTLALLLCSGALALATTAAHLAMFLYLDSRLVGNGIPQAYVFTFSVALTHVFSLALGTCLTVGMSQALWYYARKNLLPLCTIDNLFKLLRNPLGALDLKIPLIAPLMVLFAVALLAIRIAVIFPPGALVIALATHETIKVYTLQTANYSKPPGYLTFSNVTSSADYKGLTTEKGVWYSLLDLGMSSMSINFQATPLTVPLQLDTVSPCGLNCSYEVEAALPSVQCEPGLSLDLIQHFYGTENVYGLDYESFSSLNLSYMAISHINQEQIDGQSTHTLRLDVSFGPASSLNYTCLIYSNRARLQLSWSPEGNSVAVLSRSSRVFNASMLIDPLYVNTYGQTDRKGTTEMANSLASSFPTNFDCQAQSWDCEALSEFESLLQLLQPLSGWMSTNPNATAALPIGTCNDPIHPGFLTDIERTEEVFWNASVQAFLYLNLVSSASTNATTTTEANTYQFEKRLNFYLPYGMSLGVSAVLLGISIFFLNDNGFDGGVGFLDILCNTATLNFRVRGLALQGAGRDAAARPTELLEEKVIFGVVRCEDGVSRIGLGAEEDTLSLKTASLEAGKDELRSG